MLYQTIRVASLAPLSITPLSVSPDLPFLAFGDFLAVSPEPFQPQTVTEANPVLSASAVLFQLEGH